MGVTGLWGYETMGLVGAMRSLRDYGVLGAVGDSRSCRAMGLCRAMGAIGAIGLLMESMIILLMYTTTTILLMESMRATRISGLWGLCEYWGGKGASEG